MPKKLISDHVEVKITNKYELIEKVGQGANGIVWKAIHR